MMQSISSNLGFGQLTTGQPIGIGRGGGGGAISLIGLGFGGRGIAYPFPPPSPYSKPSYAYGKLCHPSFKPLKYFNET